MKMCKNFFIQTFKKLTALATLASFKRSFVAVKSFESPCQTSATQKSIYKIFSGPFTTLKGQLGGFSAIYTDNAHWEMVF